MRHDTAGVTSDVVMLISLSSHISSVAAATLSPPPASSQAPALGKQHVRPVDGRHADLTSHLPGHVVTRLSGCSLGLPNEPH